ncbi:MAG TPA: DUF6789 family protein [Roseiflexaceae bacterium]|nr:DUF6789 family protein [Roseiflexaceae bacterium]
MSSTIEASKSAARIPEIPGLGGALAGLAGGAAMAVVAAIISASIGGDIWLEAKQIATMVYGPEAATASGFVAGPVIAGTLIHFLFSMLFGSFYSLLTRRLLQLPTDFGTPILSGLIYGMMVWMLAYFVVLPVMDSALMQTYAPAFIVQHLVYGVVLGLVYAALRPQPYVERYWRAEVPAVRPIENTYSLTFTNGRDSESQS